MHVCEMQCIALPDSSVLDMCVFTVLYNMFDVVAGVCTQHCFSAAPVCVHCGLLQKRLSLDIIDVESSSGRASVVSNHWFALLC